jgi:DNA sulfur modification protein DndC
VTPEILRRLEAGDQDIALVINHSGGKDSTAMLAYLVERFPLAKKYVIYADTGFEHVRPISAEDFARQICERFGLELGVCRNPNKTYLEMVERRGMFPSPSTRQCTSDLKRGPIETWIRNNVSEKTIVSCMGIRAAESSARAKQNPWKRNESLSKAGRTVYNWMPIFDWSHEAVYQYLADRQIPLHPVYQRAGGYLNRFSCRVCIFATLDDLQAIAANDPEAFELVASLEERIGFTMQPGRTLREAVAQPSRSLPILEVA